MIATDDSAAVAWADRLAQAVRSRSAVLVGLDPRADLLPDACRAGDDSPEAVSEAYRVFCCGVIDAVESLVGVVKPQVAFFEQQGPAGMAALAAVIRHARARGLLVLIDAKRNDIGSTAAAYADAWLGANSVWGGDALTVSPYLGDDSLQPFVETAVSRDGGVFVLVKTSNPGGKVFQDLQLNSPEHRASLYEQVADLVELLAAGHCGDCGYGAVGAVVGATYPSELAALRERMPHAWLLIPGFGAQGGTAADVAAGFDHHGLGAIVNSSRGIIFAHQRDEYKEIGRGDWQRAVEQATRDMRQQLDEATGRQQP